VRVVTNDQRSDRRTDALSKERIVEVAVEILDSGAESALTFRALASRLSTGIGAISWHVAKKDDLLAASTNDVVGRVVADVVGNSESKECIRAIILAVINAIDAHPWVGTQLAREPWQPAMLHVFEGIGRVLQALGLPGKAQFNCATALMSYIIGLAAQYAAGARLFLSEADRSAFLAVVAAQWTNQHDAANFPFVHQVAGQLPDHEGREQIPRGHRPHPRRHRNPLVSGCPPEVRTMPTDSAVTASR
jgi:AcrR family transcriptional regulator